MIYADGKAIKIKSEKKRLANRTHGGMHSTVRLNSAPVTGKNSSDNLRLPLFFYNFSCYFCIIDVIVEFHEAAFQHNISKEDIILVKIIIMCYKFLRRKK